jgi:beta-glucosidase
MKNRLIRLSVILGVVLGVLSCKKSGNNTESSSKKAICQVAEITTKFDKKIDSLIAQMTLEEKVGMLHANTMFSNGGVERLGIPEIKMADGPLGIREEINKNNWAPAGWTNDFATYYPAAGALAATWSPEMASLFGKSVGQEARAREKDMLLSPAINIIRTPLSGRTYEFLTEDPFLNKKMTVPFIAGVQQNDVMTCVKHYAVNNQETNRGTVDVQVDERALREIYLPAFKAAVTEANAYSIMGAYNKFRDHYLCENDLMLNKILRDEWGFQGIVVSDWAAVHSTVKSLKNGLDIEMGTPRPFNKYYLADALVEAAKKGEISEAEINKHVRRILKMMFQVKAIGGEDRVKGSIATKEHYQDVYKIASEAVVLLKNKNNLLPLKLDGVNSIAVIGNNATKTNAARGFGAGVKTKREITPLEGLKNRLPKGIKINYAEGYQGKYAKIENDQKAKVTVHGVVTVNDLNLKLVDEALTAAKNSDVTILFVGSNRDYETEASDRRDLSLPYGQEKLIEKVLKVEPNAIVVFIAGAPFDIANIKERTHALVWSWFNGSEGGNALADVLLGNVNPSGKLPWTIPVKIEDSPAHATNSFPGDESVIYKEGILVGYRWFDTKNIEPLYPFGYGLSYTTFELSGFKTDKETYNTDETIIAELTVKNTGIMDGKEVVQLYVSKPDSRVERAEQELKGFKKVEVKTGTSGNVRINIPVKELAFYDVENKAWKVEKGRYILKVGNSSRNIIEELTVTIN